MLDIRRHGNSSTASSSPSSSSSTFDRPHDFCNCVNDVFETLVPLGLVGNNSPTAICGHSLGGRLALEYAHSVMRAASTPSSLSLSAGLRMPKQTWILDSVPRRANLSVHGVLRAVSLLRRPFPSRGWVVNELIGEKHGLDRSLANWIMMGLREETKGGSNNTDGRGGGEGLSSSSSLDWAFDLDVANELVKNCRDGTRRHDRIRCSRNISSSNSNCRRTDCCWSGCGRPAAASSRGCVAAATATATLTSLFVASNVGKEIIVWSEADPKLKKWVTKIRLQLTASQLSNDRVKVLNHVNFPRSLHEKKWNRHYEELLGFTHSTAIAMCIGPAALASG